MENKFPVNYYGTKRNISLGVQLYDVCDFMGKEMSGLAITFTAEGDEVDIGGYSGVLTVSFGQFIGLKNAAYIDTNNCPFATDILKSGIAKETGLAKQSGFCEYPLYVFDEAFLREIGGDNYEQYAKEYDAYFKAIYEGIVNDNDDQEGV